MLTNTIATKYTKSIHFLTLILFILWAIPADAQNIFQKTYDNCNTTRFCLDCGDTKVEADSSLMAKMIENLNHRVYINNLKGSVYAQVLVDATGKGCVLSHSETKGLTVSEKMVWALNDFKGWKPAITNGKPEAQVAIIFQFLIENGKITGQVLRMTEEMINKLNKP